jgi:hypothetical protein
MAGRILIEKSAKGEATIDRDALTDETIKPKSWMQ